VVGDLTSIFNFANPNQGHVKLPSTDAFLPSPAELGGGSLDDFIPSLATVSVGVPQQEKGIRPARALPYELNVHATVNSTASTVDLKFIKTGAATAVFQVRSGNPTEAVRTYTVEPNKNLSDTWHVVSSYDLSVYGPNGFLRSFKGSIGSHAAVLDVSSRYWRSGRGAIAVAITNLTHVQAEVSVLDAYTGRSVTAVLHPGQTFEDERPIDEFGGWYDRIVKVAADSSFAYELAGHVETGDDGISDPALGGLVTLKT